MWQTFGQLLPIALGLALSTVPITVAVLVLLSPRRDVAAIPFLVGWLIGIVAVTGLFTIGAGALPDRPFRSHQIVAVLELVIGAGLVVLSIIAFRRARRRRDEALPKWLRSVSQLGPWSALGLALLLNIRPKSLLLAAAAGLALRTGDLDPGETIALLVIFGVLAASTIAVPVIATLASPARMEPRLVRTRDWLTQNGGIVTALLMLMLGVVIVGAGLGGL